MIDFISHASMVMALIAGVVLVVYQFAENIMLTINDDEDGE